MTKYLEEAKSEKFMQRLGLQAKEGRHSSAPETVRPDATINFMEEQLWIEKEPQYASTSTPLPTTAQTVNHITIKDNVIEKEERPREIPCMRRS